MKNDFLHGPYSIPVAAFEPAGVGSNFYGAFDRKGARPAFRNCRGSNCHGYTCGHECGEGGADGRVGSLLTAITKTIYPRTVHGQNKTNIREGWLRGSDVNLQKSVFVAERIRMPLQLRAFNVLNQVSFGGPSVRKCGRSCGQCGAGRSRREEFLLDNGSNKELRSAYVSK